MNIRPETDKLLEENIGGRPLNIGFVNDFFGFDTKSEGNKSNNKQVELCQTKKFCTAKEAINRMKRQCIEWEKIFANHVSNKGLTSKI